MFWRNKIGSRALDSRIQAEAAISLENKTIQYLMVQVLEAIDEASVLGERSLDDFFQNKVGSKAQHTAIYSYLTKKPYNYRIVCGGWGGGVHSITW